MTRIHKCIVIEDEPLAQSVLQKYITDHPSLELTAVCSDALEAQAILAREPAALLFLDINLPKLSGISFLKTLSHPPLIIFTTAYPEYAVEGFELDATDYLLKPFSFERFLKAVNKALEKLERNGTVQTASTSLYIKSDKKVYRLEMDDILYVEAVDDYVKIVTTQKTYLVHDTLKSLSEELPGAQFMRVHKSYIIALNKVVYYEGNYIKISDRDIPVGASYRDAFNEKLKR